MNLEFFDLIGFWLPDSARREIEQSPSDSFLASDARMSFDNGGSWNAVGDFRMEMRTNFAALNSRAHAKLMDVPEKSNLIDITFTTYFHDLEPWDGVGLIARMSQELIVADSPGPLSYGVGPSGR
jgi:hypothetical protein